ncbi:MAG: sigma-54 dependent transcriptional regulator [Pseudohongiellaceae bacterium]
MANAVLLVTDDDTIASKTATVFEFIDHSVVRAADTAETGEHLAADKYLVALVRLEDADRQTSIIDQINKQAPSLPIFLLFSKDGGESAGKLPRKVAGALNYPVQYRDVLSIIRQAELDNKNQGARKKLSVSLTGNSPHIKNIEGLVRHVAMTDANVLLSGESGTGKEVVARSIHNLSLRADKPFVAVNCGAIPPELLESELFGHEKGSFTGAIHSRAGRFELAEGGTLFLDEIGDMPMPMQVKLLRIIQERTFERVGGTKTITSDVRLVAATHQDLEKRIGEGKFRLDLFYRLNVFPIELPPLRNRPEDIPLLIKEFAYKMELERRSPIEFDDSAIGALVQNPLPGNVRELENLVERLAILYPGETITRVKLPARYRGQGQEDDSPAATLNGNNAAPAMNSTPLDSQDTIDLKQHLANVERALISRALEKSNWVVSQAAKSLSLRRTTLIEKIRKLEIKQPEQESERPPL